MNQSRIFRLGQRQYFWHKLLLQEMHLFALLEIFLWAFYPIRKSHFLLDQVLMDPQKRALWYLGQRYFYLACHLQLLPTVAQQALFHQ